MTPTILHSGSDVSTQFVDHRPVMKKPIIWWRSCFLAFLLAGVSGSAAAASCNTYASNLVFGTVNLLAGGITDSSGTVNYGCSANPGTRVLLCFSMGPDPSTGLYNPRNLASQNNKMAFNLYTDAGRSVIWGSTDSGGAYPPLPVVMDFGAGQYYKSATLPLYGRINSAGQMGLPAGYYDTNSIGGWPMSVSYKELAGSAPPDCSSGSMTKQSATFYIQAIVNSDCRINASTTMDFGTVFMELNQNVDSVSTITVTCNGGQSGNGYHVRLGQGLNAGGQQRRMRGTSGYIKYELYRDPQRTSRWGNTNYEGVAGVGTGQPQTLTVYGRVPAQTVPGAGLYSDTIVITLSY